VLPDAVVVVVGAGLVVVREGVVVRVLVLGRDVGVLLGVDAAGAGAAGVAGTSRSCGWSEVS
jgi:ABC-type enterochelin transport system permease subunit